MSHLRFRRVSSAIALVLAVVIFTIGLFTMWAGSTIYDSNTFADRSVSMLKEPAVRTELAARITEQLARAGNQNAVNFRPAFQLAVEAAIDTDTFQSIFRTAVFRTHSAVLASQDDDPDSSALDLSDSVSIIVSNLSLPSNANPGQQTGSGGLDNSLGDVTKRLTDLGIWNLEDYAGTLTVLGLVGGPLLAAAGIALSTDRRRTLRRLGWGVMIGGLVLAALVPLTQIVVGWRISDGGLSKALSAGLGNVLADLRTIGLWVAVYGLLLAAAARSYLHPRPTPVRVWARFRAWVARRQATTGGTVVLGAGALVLGAIVVGNSSGVLTLVVIIGGIWLSYFGVTELTRMFRPPPPVLDASGVLVAQARHWTPRRVAVVTGIAVLAVVVLGVGALVTTRQAARTAEAAGVPECNGEKSLCDVPLNLAMFAGSHNSMSSALYPGWLFAEQTSTLTGQLDAGIRALLIDTHYGIPSTAKLPGSETPVVITDRAAELATPPGDSYDQAIADRAQQVAANAPPKAGAQRDIYLCHNFCEMGAVSFTDQMAQVKKWVDNHPEEVVIIIVEDHTEPAETAAALEASGLTDRAYTLDPLKPIPTMGDMINAGKNVLLFAENGGPGSPDWYHSAYKWFQETPYAWKSVDEMTCASNRGVDTNPFMLINHWVGYSPPDPGKAGSVVNTRAVLENRIERCIDDRDVGPTIVAVDFAERGDLVKVVDDYNRQVQDILGQINGTRTPSTDDAPDSTAPSSTTTSVVGSSTGSLYQPPTAITSLTGGDPAVFCASASPFVATMQAWAIADLSKPTAAAGLPSLTYGPLAARQIAGLEPSTPEELVAQFSPAAAQADAAVAALRQAGLQQADIDALADTAADQLSGTNPDPALVEQALVDLLIDRLGRDGVFSLAASFDAAHPIAAGVFDLGDVSTEVATTSGYGCVNALG